MLIETRTGEVMAEKSDLGILACCSNEPLPDAITDLLEPQDFTGAAEQSRLLYPRRADGPRRLLLIGLGERAQVDAERVRRVTASAIRQARDLQVGHPLLGVSGELAIGQAALGEAVAEGLELGAYRYLHHRTGLTDEQRFEVEAVTVVTPSSADELAAGVATGQAIARGVIFARDLVNRPPESKTPPALAEQAVQLAERCPGVTATVFDEARLTEEGFGGILAVGRASAAEPRFVVLEYGADLEGAKTVCLVGKGLTFDSGGLNIKPAEGMFTMKNDMAGAATVFAVMEVVAQLGLPVHLVGLVPSAENMIDGNAYRPGDIVTSLSGKTIEIINTDAEGRVILCDGLHYAQRFEPDAIINVATLTGAVLVALGQYASGLCATDDELADALVAAGEATSDRVWRLPMDGEYATLSDSEIADLKNHPGKFAGSIGAAVFLAAFVGEHRFAHLDIAGTAWLDAPTKPYHTKGGTGSGVPVLVEYLRQLA